MSVLYHLSRNGFLKFWIRKISNIVLGVPNNLSIKFPIGRLYTRIQPLRKSLSLIPMENMFFVFRSVKIADMPKKYKSGSDLSRVPIEGL